MSQNLYKEYDDILELRKNILQYAEDNYRSLHDSVEAKSDTIKYGRNSLYLGYFCPSLVIDKVTKGFKKGRLLNSIPKTNKGYVLYELDCDGKLLRMKEINSFGTIFESYVIKRENAEFTVTILNGKKCSIVDSTRSIYDGDKLIRFDIIGSTHIWSEVYSYNPYDSKSIECKQYYYVQELKNSNKSIRVGQIGSPMKLFNMSIHLDEKNIVSRIEYGEFINDKTEISYVYEK